MSEVHTSEKMTSSEEEEVMLDLEKCNLWLLLMQELQEKEHKCSSGKEILKTLRHYQKISKDG